MKSARNPAAIPGDNPIRDPEADVLDRLNAARSFAKQVLSLDASEGVAVGVFGPWGSGKTSFINLARKEFKQKGTPVLDFNPWMFSGAEQLVERFFSEISAKLKLHDLANVSKTLADYGDVVRGKVGLCLRITGKFLNRRQGGIAGYRRRVEQALEKHDKPIVAVLDDVDRLTASEIRDIFKLVRLTGSFPNLIYIVVCDRLRVEQVLTEEGLPGRDYLEKIIQLPFDLPEVPRHKLQEQILGEIEHATAVDTKHEGCSSLRSRHPQYSRQPRRQGCARRCTRARSRSVVPAGCLPVLARCDRRPHRTFGIWTNRKRAR